MSVGARCVVKYRMEEKKNAPSGPLVLLSKQTATHATNVNNACSNNHYCCANYKNVLTYFVGIRILCNIIYIGVIY